MDSEQQPALNLATLLSDPDVFKVLLNTIGIRYTTTKPTHTPNKETEIWVYFDATNYWLEIWANGAWREQKIGVAQSTSVQFGTYSFSVPAFTNTDTTTTHDFGFVPKMVFGTLGGGGSSNAVFFGMWQNGQEQRTAIVTDGSGSSGVPFLGIDNSYYVNNLSVSGNVLTLHYKSTGTSTNNCDIWAIGL